MKNTLILIVSLFLALASFIGGLVARALDLPPAYGAVAFVFTTLAILVPNRQRISSAFDSFRSGQIRTGVCIMLLFAAVSSVLAAANIEDSITSLIVRPSGTRTSDTNGMIRLYSANESNFWAVLTNLQQVKFTPTGLRTGYTGKVIGQYTNGTTWTNMVEDGIVTATNTY